MSLLKKLFSRSDKSVENKYVSAGEIFGDAVSYIGLRECGGFDRMLNRWAKWEREYSERGFRTISLDRFISFGGYGKPINDVLGQKREEGEEPILHADIYRSEYLGKIEPVIDLGEMMQPGGEQIQSGTIILPSTEE